MSRSCNHDLSEQERQNLEPAIPEFSVEGYEAASSYTEQ